MKRAQGIIASDKPPPRMNEDPTFTSASGAIISSTATTMPRLTLARVDRAATATRLKVASGTAKKEEYLDRTAQEMACHDHDVISRAD